MSFFRCLFGQSAKVQNRSSWHSREYSTPRRRRMTPRLRNTVWAHYHSDITSGPCYVCGETIHRTRWQCAHVKAHVHGGEETLDNLRTTCPPCNQKMGDQNLYAYIRDNRLTGPGAVNVKPYMKYNKSERKSKRTR